MGRGLRCLRGRVATAFARLCNVDGFVVSYLALNDMLTVHVVHKPTKRSAKLHFLTREAMVIKSMLQRYADAVLHELQKLDKERANREKLKGGA